MWHSSTFWFILETTFWHLLTFCSVCTGMKVTKSGIIFCVVPLSDMALPPFLCTLECWSVKDWRWCCRYHYHFAFCAVCGGYWMISQNLAGFHCHTTCRTHLKKIKIITQVKIPFQRACTYVGFPFQCTEFMNVLTINCPFKENQPQNLLLSRHIILPFLPLHIIMKWLTLRML